MEEKKAREYQTVRLFATLAFLTLLIVLLFKVVLFGPQNQDKIRLPAQQPIQQSTQTSDQLMPDTEKK